MRKSTAGHRMRQEILQQPEAIAATLAAETDRIREFAARLQREDISQVLLVARGTSDNAAMYARYAFPIIAGRLTSLTATSLLTVYDVDIDLNHALVLGISQSGESVGVLEFLDHARHHGAITCGLTNTARAAISDAAEVVLCTHAREEQSVPATKTYTTALAVLHQLASLWAGDIERAKRIYEVPKWISEVLAMEDQIQDRAERFRFMSTCAVMARGFSLTTALETAQKLAQCCYVVPASYSGADFLHGPIASIEPGFPCFAYAPQGKALQSMSELIDAVRERNAETIVISNVGPLLDKATVCLPIPDMPEEFAPMVAIVIGQLLALHTAIHKGIDPDEPRGVSKTTLTL
jgi:glucosamine--fructose-6-phosphate aminotransferase (isomerizing)